MDPDYLLVYLRGLVAVTKGAIYVGAIKLEPHILRISPHCLDNTVPCQSSILLLQSQVDELLPQRHVLGRDVGGQHHEVDGLVDLAILLVDAAEQVVRVGQVGRDPHDLVQDGDGLLEPVLGEEQGGVAQLLDDLGAAPVPPPSRPPLPLAVLGPPPLLPPEAEPLHQLVEEVRRLRLGELALLPPLLGGLVPLRRLLGEGLPLARQRRQGLEVADADGGHGAAGPPLRHLHALRRVRRVAELVPLLLILVVLLPVPVLLLVRLLLRPRR
uniref:Uncharacterized protein n=1 Tax=Triticum urartu TaxID=4572 RepID=A0A8R7UMD3_TRIUA